MKLTITALFLRVVKPCAEYWNFYTPPSYWCRNSGELRIVPTQTYSTMLFFCWRNGCFVITRQWQQKENRQFNCGAFQRSVFYKGWKNPNCQWERQQRFQNESQTELGNPRGQIFEFLCGCLKNDLTFDEFFNGKKKTKINKSRWWRERNDCA